MILQVTAINTYYGSSHILQDVSFSVDQGEVVALLGRNGVGKTTTLRSMMGLTPPKSGSILEKGRIVHEGSMEDIWADEEVIRRYLVV